MHAGIPFTFYLFFSLGSQPMDGAAHIRGWVESSLIQSLWNTTPSQTYSEMPLLHGSKSSQADSED